MIKKKKPETPKPYMGMSAEQQEICRGCMYSGILNNQIVVCEYICYTGKRRGCKPEECDKFKPMAERERMFNNDKFWY